MATKFDYMKSNLEENKKYWMKKYGANDITIGLKEKDGELTSDLCYKFWVPSKVSKEVLKESKIIPTKFGRNKTDVKNDEVYDALDVDGTTHLRPCPMGSSIGNKEITAGTAGFVYERDGKLFILSNAHVLAEDPFDYVSHQETEVHQPGPFHDDNKRIGKLRYMVMLNNQSNSKKESYKLESDGTIEASVNTVDAALCLPDSQDDIENRVIGIPNTPLVSECIVEPGDKIVLSSWRMIQEGCEDGVSRGKVTDVGRTATIRYGNGKTATLVDLIVTTRIGRSGTSGSGVVREPDMAAVGLNFAGSSTTNLVCGIQHINVAFGGRVKTVDEVTPPKPPSDKIYDMQVTMTRDGGNKDWTINVKTSDSNGFLPFVTVNIDGATEGKTGRYSELEIIDVPDGQHIMHFSKKGYTTEHRSFQLNPDGSVIDGTNSNYSFTTWTSTQPMETLEHKKIKWYTPWRWFE